jgi:hypothetical protein
MANFLRDVTNIDVEQSFSKIKNKVFSNLGGGGTTGGSVVQYTPSNIAAQAGQYGVNAANEASSLAAQSIGAAIGSINSQYQTATAALQPYTQEGIQSLDKLNQYLGLSAYNPGKAPVAPTAPTLASLKSGISSSAVAQYVSQNSSLGHNAAGQQFGNYAYSGVGYDNPNVAGPGSSGADNALNGITNQNDSATNLGTFSRIFGDSIKTQLAQDQLNDPNSYANLLYGVQNNAYNTQSDQYNYAKNLQGQYDAQGPLTSQQISDNISSQPGYQAQLGQGIDAINKDSAAKGYLGSGALLKELNSFGQNTLSQYYGNTLNRLASLAGAGQQAATSTANNATNTGNSLASLFSSLGTAQGNAALSAGNSLSQSLIAGNQEYKTVGGSEQSGAGGIGSILSGLGSLAAAANL